MEKQSRAVVDGTFFGPDGGGGTGGHGQNERERMPLYREHRTLLRNGQWRRVVEECRDWRIGTSEWRQCDNSFATAVESIGNGSLRQ